MQKIIIAKKGQFLNLSSEAIFQLIERKSSYIIQEKLDYDLETELIPFKNGFFEVDQNYYGGLVKDGIEYHVDTSSHNFRTNLDIIDIVQSLGKDALHKEDRNDVELTIMEIPDDVQYHIVTHETDDYPCYEKIVEKHRTWDPWA